VGVIEELLVRIVGDNSDLKAALGDSEKQIQSMGKSLESGLKAANKAALVVGAAVVAIGGLAIHSAMDFEKAFAGVVQNVNDSEEALARLRGELREMAKDTGFAATALSSVASAAGELGFNAQAAKDFTQTVTDFARATGASLEEATTALEGYVRQAQVAPGAVRELTSVAVALSDKLGGQEENLLAIAASLDATTKAAGIGKVGTLAMAGALNALGIDAGRGASAFKGLLVNMSGAIAKGGKELEGFAQIAGMSSAAFAKGFKEDAAGAVQAFLVGLRGIQGDSTTTINALDALGLADNLTRDTLLRAAEGADKFGLALQTATNEAANATALTNNAAIANETAAVKFEKLQQRVNDLGISIGAALLPAFEALIGVIGPVVDWLGQNEEVATALLVTFGFLAAAIIAVNLATKAYVAITAIVKAATIAWTAIQWLLNIALTANPIGIIIVAIAALVAAIIIVIAFWDEILGGMKIVADWIVGVFQGIWQGLADFFVSLWEGVKAVFSAAWDFILTILLAPIQVFMVAWNAVADFFPGLWEDIKGIFLGVVSWFVDIGKNIVDGFWKGLKSAWDNVTGWIGDAIDGVKDFFTSGFGLFSPSKVFADYGENIVAGLREGVAGMEDAINEPIQAAKDAAQVNMQATATVVQTASAGVGAAATAASQPPSPVVPATQSVNQTSVVFSEGAIQLVVAPGVGGGLDIKSIGEALRRELSDIFRSAAA